MNDLQNNLANEERETHFNILASDRSVCQVFTDDPVWYARLTKWFEPEWTDGKSARFTLPTSIVIRESALKSGNARLQRHLDGAEGSPNLRGSEATGAK